MSAPEMSHLLLHVLSRGLTCAQSHVKNWLTVICKLHEAPLALAG
jgi:hypothetical protein